MKLLISGNRLYVDQLFFCCCEAGNGRDVLPRGRYPVFTTYSHVFGKDLPNAEGIGWIGDTDACDVVLGRVYGRDKLLPCPTHLSRLLALLETAEDDGCKIEMVVEL